MDLDSAHAVPAAARRAARAAGAPLVLAVSGGLDSMALLVAMAGVARARIAAVATFDHGTGPAATAAAAHVARVSATMGLPVVIGHLRATERGRDGWEAAWRKARHAFLEGTAESLGARVVTAHTEDDQVETVLMRVLRGSGARGLAGLAAPSPIIRPFLGLRRAALDEFLRGSGYDWVEDPTNASPAFLRNRLRRDLLPALRRANPGVDDVLLASGRRAARWRGEVDEMVLETLRPAMLSGGGLSVASAELAGYSRDSLAMMWGSLASRAGLALDRRGTDRLASFTIQERRGGLVPLSGGWCLEARPGKYLLRRVGAGADVETALPGAGALTWGRFRFTVRDAGASVAAGEEDWSAWLPADAGMRVRGWTAGDRLLPAGRQPRRRVTRYLSDAGLRGSDRAGWPVVVWDGAGDGDVVWIPGVRRSDAATERSGRPVRHYVCERIAP